MEFPRTFGEARALLLDGRTTATELTDLALQRAGATQHLNIYLELFPDSARTQAADPGASG